MKNTILFLFILVGNITIAQTDTLKKNRVAWVAGANVALGGGSVLLLNEVWYKDYPKSKLHFFNDGNNWLQMDKVGHAYTAYQLCRAENAAWQWTGMSNNKSALLSAGIAWTYQFSVEILDGLSEEWGFSAPDLAANTAGIGLFLGQQLAFKKQIFYLKYGYKASPYAELRPNTLGANLPERLLKDYNAQSYWLSFSPKFIATALPNDWLNCIQLSIGYSADAKLRGDDNNYTINGFTYHAEREYAISLDFDWSKLPVKKPWLKKGLSALNAVKLPFPAVYWRNGVCYVGMF